MSDERSMLGGLLEMLKIESELRHDKEMLRLLRQHPSRWAWIWKRAAKFYRSRSRDHQFLLTAPVLLEHLDTVAALESAEKECRRLHAQLTESETIRAGMVKAYGEAEADKESNARLCEELRACLAEAAAERGELRARVTELKQSIAEIHAATGRGDHGTAGNASCALDAILSLKEDRDEDTGYETESEWQRRKLDEALAEVRLIAEQIADWKARAARWKVLAKVLRRNAIDWRKQRDERTTEMFKTCRRILDDMSKLNDVVKAGDAMASVIADWLKCHGQPGIYDDERNAAALAAWRALRAKEGA